MRITISVIIYVPISLLLVTTTQSMEKKFPQLPKKPESYLYYPEKEELNEESLEEIQPEIAALIAGVEDISLLENPEKEALIPVLEEEREHTFKPFESFKPTIMSRIMTSKNPRASTINPDFPELWFEDPDLKNVEEAIKRGAPINQTHPINPLRYAVLDGNIALAELLIRYGARPDVRDMSGFNAFDAASSPFRTKPLSKEQQEKLTKLLKQGLEFKSKAQL